MMDMAEPQAGSRILRIISHYALRVAAAHLLTIEAYLPGPHSVHIVLPGHPLCHSHSISTTNVRANPDKHSWPLNTFDFNLTHFLVFIAFLS